MEKIKGMYNEFSKTEEFKKIKLAAGIMAAAAFVALGEYLITEFKNSKTASVS
jgi:hypothetical protein